MPNRIIKESVWSSDNLCKTSLLAQAFFMRLIPLPDDHGCFDARSSILRARLYPLNYAQVSERKIDEWIEELISVDCIRVWTESCVRYGYIPAWGKHQQVRSLHHRKTPAPPLQIVTGERVTENKDDSNCYQALAVESLNPNPNPNPNLEKKGEGESAAPSVLALGEHGFAKMTSEEHGKIEAKCGAHAEKLIGEFDNWVAQAPDAKKDGIRRRDRHAYATITAWYYRAVREGKIQVQSSSHDPPAAHSLHRCPMCARPHDWNCDDPDNCDRTILLACPEFRHALKGRMVTAN